MHPPCVVQKRLKKYFSNWSKLLCREEQLFKHKSLFCCRSCRELPRTGLLRSKAGRDNSSARCHQVSTVGALRRSEKVPGSLGAEAWRRFVDHCESPPPRRFLGMLLQMSTCYFGNVLHIFVENVLLVYHDVRLRRSQASPRML